MKEYILIAILALNVLATAGLYYTMNTNGNVMSSRLLSIEKTEVDHGTNILFLMGKRAKP